MRGSSGLRPQETPKLFAVLDADAVAAWVIELPHGSVLALFPDGVAVHTTDSTERALNFVNRAEDIAGELIAVPVCWPNEDASVNGDLRTAPTETGDT